MPMRIVGQPLGLVERLGRARALTAASSRTVSVPASQTQSGHSSESEINHLVMAITSAEATFWHYRFRQMARLPHVAGELIAHVKCDVADPGDA
jgi:hypothetical protein